MELMDHSLHQLYKLVYETLKLSIPEEIVGKMAESVSPVITPLCDILHYHFSVLPCRPSRLYTISSSTLMYYIEVCAVGAGQREQHIHCYLVHTHRCEAIQYSHQQEG